MAARLAREIEQLQLVVSGLEVLRHIGNNGVASLDATGSSVHAVTQALMSIPNTPPERSCIYSNANNTPIRLGTNNPLAANCKSENSVNRPEFIVDGDQIQVCEGQCYVMA
jgi:hypothetical protein